MSEVMIVVNIHIFSTNFHLFTWVFAGFLLRVNDRCHIAPLILVQEDEMKEIAIIKKNEKNLFKSLTLRSWFSPNDKINLKIYEKTKMKSKIFMPEIARLLCPKVNKTQWEEVI